MASEDYDFWDEAVGVADTALALASPIIAEPFAGWAGIVSGGDPEAVRYMQDRMTWAPKTDEGARNMGILGEGIQSVMDYKPLLRDQTIGEDLQAAGDYWRDSAIPALQDTFGSEAGAGIGAAGVGILGTVGLPARAGKKMAGLLDSDALALDYPSPGTPQLNVDKKSGKQFMSKGLSDTELALQKERNRINKEVIAPGDYEPMFPLADRYYADPTPYNIQGDTQIDARPKTQKTIDAKIAQFDTPAARKSLVEAYQSGDGALSRDWYAVGQLENAFIDELGPEAGRGAFKERFADAMAATTGGADPGSNLLMATYGNFLKSKGESPPGNAYLMPHPIGGRYVTGNMKMYDKYINQGESMSAAGHPKRHNFSSNFLGDRSHATIDEQMTRGMTGGKLNAPPQGAYSAMEGVVIDEARKLGIEPANLQDVAWAGYKGVEGKPMIQWVNEMIERTSQVTGKSREDVLKGLIRGNMPMYGMAGALAGGAAMQQQDPEGRLGM